MPSRDPIRGKVAHLVSSREIALNIGAESGVRVGMRFAIHGQRGRPVLDPDTNEKLGELPLTKAVVKVVRVDGKKLATARTFRTIPAVPGLADLVYKNSLSGQAESVETLTLDPSHKKADDDLDKTVRVGDPVVEVDDDSYDEV